MPQVMEESRLRIKQLEMVVKEQNNQIQKLKKPVNKQRRRPKNSKSDFIRVIIPDTHGSHCEQSAIDALLNDIEKLKPSEVIMLGDHIDCGGFLAQHHVMGYVAESSNSFSDDVQATNRFLDDLQSIVPEAEILYLEGNHERRIEQWCVTQSLKNGNPKDAQYLSSIFSTEKVLSLQERGIQFFKQGVCYDGLRIPATIKRGSCYFTHGTRTGVHAAKQTLGDFGGNVVFGHTHRIQSHQSWTVDGGDVAAWNIGCLSKMQPYWRNNSPTGWSHGYGVQLVKKTGAFIHLTVPIIKGESYLMSLFDK